MCSLHNSIFLFSMCSNCCFRYIIILSTFDNQLAKCSTLMNFFYLKEGFCGLYLKQLWNAGNHLGTAAQEPKNRHTRALTMCNPIPNSYTTKLFQRSNYLLLEERFLRFVLKTTSKCRKPPWNSRSVAKEWLLRTCTCSDRNREVATFNVSNYVTWILTYVAVITRWSPYLIGDH